MVRKKTLSELEQAEIKLQSLVEKREALNAKASEIRDDRDQVHAKKRELVTHLRELKAQRGDCAASARSHRERREALRSRARAMIELRGKVRSHVSTRSSGELRAVRGQITAMELRQQTQALSLREEKELLDDLKGKLQRAKALESLKADEDHVVTDVRDLDVAITDLFHEADREHQASVVLSAKAREISDEIESLGRSIAPLVKEGEDRHQSYLEVRADADAVHAKIVAMRREVVAVHEAKRAEQMEARRLLTEQNLSVRRRLLDRRTLDQAADEALRALLKQGRVEIGR